MLRPQCSCRPCSTSWSVPTSDRLVATTGTIRTQLINIATRLARSARRLRLHLPEHWPCEHAWQQQFQATLTPAPC